MDLEYNNKLQAIMKKHNTDVWNKDCENDPDYEQAQKSRMFNDDYEKSKVKGKGMPDRSSKGFRESPFGNKPLRLGGYVYKSKR